MHRRRSLQQRDDLGGHGGRHLPGVLQPDALQVEDDDAALDLGARLQDAQLQDDEGGPEQVVYGHLAGVPVAYPVHHDATAELVQVREDRHDIRLAQGGEALRVHPLLVGGVLLLEAHVPPQQAVGALHVEGSGAQEA